MLGTATNRSNSIVRRLLPDLTLIAVLMLSVCAHSLQAGSGPPRGEAPKGQKHEMRHEIDRLEETWREAILKQDPIAMGNLLADDYIAITAYGTLQTKDQALADLRSGRAHFTMLDVSDRKIRFYGKTALVTSKVEIKGTTPEGDISGGYRYTRVYVRDAQGAWKIVSFEVSKIRVPGEHK
jgi:ketosteroid isomerase-like protein